MNDPHSFEPVGKIVDRVITNLKGGTMGKSLSTKEQQIAKTMLANGASLRAVARSVKKSPETIRKFQSKNLEEINVLRSELADRFEDVAIRMVTDIPDEDVKKMNPYSRTLTAGIATDKANLLRGYSHDKPVVEITINHDPRGEITIRGDE